LSGAERRTRTSGARAFNAPLYLLSYLGHLIGRPEWESNLQPAACKAAALPELSYTPKIHPVTGSGAALSLRPISALEA
jgi:hypothetical protein